MARILVADDAALLRRLACRSLGEHQTIEAQDGYEALDLIQEHRPDIAILDWMMPGLSGVELCRMVRAERRARYPYFILVTALSGKGSYLEGMGAGADDFVTKPYDMDELGARLRVAQRIVSLQTEVQQLQRLLPVCGYCRRIRDTRETWSTPEQYLAEHAELLLTHSICPDCYAGQVEPELDEMEENAREKRA